MPLTRDEPPLAPLTHHEIIALAAPFTRRGFAVDLAGSDRAGRRIAFRPRPVTDGPLQLALELEDTARGWLATRTVGRAGGLPARTTALGDDIAALAERLDRVPPGQPFEHGPGHAIAWHQRVPAAGPPVLTGASLQVDGLLLELRVSAVDRIPAEMTLTAPQHDIAELPSDLLAVLGLPWARLDRTPSGWRSSLVLKGRGGARSLEAMAQWRVAADHLVRTLAEPPPRFHDRRVARRWGVTLRRAVPLLVCVGVIGAALAVPALQLSEDSVFRMLIFNAPPLLLGLLFAFRELPRIELPPPPRRPTAPAWRSTTKQMEAR